MAFGDFTVTRSTTKWVLNSAGVLSQVAINTPAFEYNTDGTYRGLLVEPAGTNSIRNNTQVGAVAGAPGTLPTNWQENTRGLTRTVVGTGTLNGVEYIDIRYNGTANATAEVQILFEGTTQIVATNGQSWANSFWFQVIAQPTPPLNYVQWTTERTAAGTAVANGSQAISTPTTWARYSFVRALAGGGTVERVTPEFRAGVTNGQSYDFTIRIGLPQMEQSAVATSVIKTSGTSLTRTADSVTLTGASSLIGQTSGGLYVEVESPNYIAPANRRVLQLSDGTTNNRISINLQGSTNRLYQLAVVNGGSVDVSILQTTGASNISRMAGAYALNDFAFYINGSLIGTDALSAVPATSRIDIGNLLGSEQFLGWIRSVALFTTRIPNATLASLTA